MDLGTAVLEKTQHFKPYEGTQELEPEISIPTIRGYDVYHMYYSCPKEVALYFMFPTLTNLKALKAYVDSLLGVAFEAPIAEPPSGGHTGVINNGEDNHVLHGASLGGNNIPNGEPEDGNQPIQK